MKAGFLWHLAETTAAQGYAKEEEGAERHSPWTIVLFLMQLECEVSM